MNDLNIDVLRDLGLSTVADAQTKKKSDLGQEDFLKLMVTQLKNQDPLEPMENGDFLAQMAQFSTVSGIGDLQTSFSDFASSVANDQALQAANLVGRNVFVPLDEAVLAAGGTLQGEMELPASSSDVNVRIYDSNGQLIRTLPLGIQGAGPVPFVWDGMLNDGTYADPGVYRVEAQARLDGENFDLETNLLAQVESVTLGGVGRGLELNLAGLSSVGINSVSRIL